MPQFNSISAVSLLFTFRIYSAVYAQAKHLFGTRNWHLVPRQNSSLHTYLMNFVFLFGARLNSSCFELRVRLPGPSAHPRSLFMIAPARAKCIFTRLPILGCLPLHFVALSGTLLIRVPELWTYLSLCELGNNKPRNSFCMLNV